MPREFRYPYDAKDLGQALDVLWDLYQYVIPFAIEVTADYTTSGKVGYEKVIVNSSSAVTVTLHSGPQDKHRVKVLRKGTGAVTVAAASGDTINGAASIVLAAQWDSPLLEYTDASGEWNIE